MEKRNVKITTAAQFQKLVNCMEDLPHLATGTPLFGSSKAAMEETWDTVAKKINAYGPPTRSGAEWKKVWADLKSRLKKKISENNISLHETGGGPCRVNNLTSLENDIDRICHMSAAAAPRGKVFGACQKQIQTTTKQKLFDVTPPRGKQNIAVVTPNSKESYRMKSSTSTPRFNYNSESPEYGELIQRFLPQRNKSASQDNLSCGVDGLEDQIYLIKDRPHRNTFSGQTVTSSSAPIKENVAHRILPANRKRKHCQSATDKTERLQLLNQQTDAQIETLNAIKEQAKAAKECANAVKESTEAIKAQSEILKTMADSISLMAKAMCDIVQHLTQEIIIADH